jgi:hypothetical protein
VYRNIRYTLEDIRYNSLAAVRAKLGLGLAIAAAPNRPARHQAQCDIRHPSAEKILIVDLNHIADAIEFELSNAGPPQ